jgi:poly(3-hydroxybutyrate) depolymerase
MAMFKPPILTAAEQVVIHFHGSRAYAMIES